MIVAVAVAAASAAAAAGAVVKSKKMIMNELNLDGLNDFFECAASDPLAHSALPRPVL